MEAAVLAEVVALVDVVTATDAQLQAALRRAWRALQAPADAEMAAAAQRSKHLEADAERARERLKRAAVLLVDGTLDKAGYELARDQAAADLDAAETELARFRSITPQASLPPLDVVLAETGGWAATLASANVAGQREILGVLVDRVIPERERWGKYRVEVVWTPLGEALRQAAGSLAMSERETAA